MTKENLLLEIKSRNCYIIEREFISQNIRAIYCDKCIALNKDITDENEKFCLIAEQLAHDYLSSGIVLNDKKQLSRARAWAFDKLIGISGLVEAFENGCKNEKEIADYLNVTEVFLKKALFFYADKYGKRLKLGDLFIKFIPELEIKRER
ncbi:MAG: hypothetical protein K5917_04245 [Clostridiales bacterium]|nr:hypothetical protein [Clostridiales bacterium]